MSDPFVVITPNRHGYLVERYEESGNVADEEQVATRPEADHTANQWLEQGWPDE